jgi:hypothetical protein
MDGPDSSYSALEIHICQEKETFRREEQYMASSNF